IARPLDAVALQGAEIIGVAALGAQLLEDLPIAPLSLPADLGDEVRAKVGGDRVVVEERVVNVDQRDHRMARHAPLYTRRTRRPRPRAAGAVPRARLATWNSPMI